MMQRMETYALERYETSLNGWNEQEKQWRVVGQIRAAISAANGYTANQNQALRISSTHRAVTPDDVRTGDRFGGYKVDYVISGRTYSQLFLTREDEIHETGV